MSQASITIPELLTAMQWRYATKVFDPTRPIPPETWKALEEIVVLTPSSFGLQPYRLLVIADPAVRTQLLPHAWNQRQVVDASHFVVFAARTGLTDAEVDKFLDRVSEVRGVDIASLTSYRNMLVGSLLSEDGQRRVPEWAARQAYIALGNLLTCAALLGLDACPMEGFVAAEFDKILNLPAQGLTATVCCALGYRAPTDKYATVRKVRFTVGEIVRHI